MTIRRKVIPLWVYKFGGTGMKTVVVRNIKRADAAVVLIYLDDSEAD
jgi:hypothetical protein